MDIRLEKIIWATGFFFHCVLVFVLIARQRWRRFPVFTALIGYHVPFSMIVWSVIRFRPSLYPIVYGVEEGVDFGLQVGLLAELASRAFRRQGTWLPETRAVLLVGSVLGLIVVGVLTTALNIATLSTKDLWDMRANVFTSLLACTLILLSSVSANRLGLQQDRHTSAIAHGFALWAATALISDVGHMQSGWREGTVIFDRLADVVWVSVLLYWSAVLWRPEAP